MLKPFYQGKVDTFCAIYAVLNALRLTHGIRVDKARDILNETLLALATSPKTFRAVLEQTTDYRDLVDSMLRVQAKRYPLEVVQPYAVSQRPTVAQVWKCMQQWLAAGDHRAAVFRFLRHMKADAPATIKHWTVTGRIEKEVLHLFDSSHDADAILNMRQTAFVTTPEDICDDRLLYLQPFTIRLLRLPF